MVPNKLKFLLSIVLILLTPRFSSHEYPRAQWIVWNVGQGLWVTHVINNFCWHYDFGGETNPINQIKEICHGRINILILSHADRDHYSFIRSIKRNLKNLCLLGPSWKMLHPFTKIGAQTIPFCQFESKESPYFYLNQNKKNILKNIQKRFRNENSQIVMTQQWILPGDATQKSEIQWLSTLNLSIRRNSLKYIQNLILGHHGSKTSTSKEFLDQLPNLLQCIASARNKKYGHPHLDVRSRIKTRCSLLLTEDWNHLHFLE